MNICRGRLVGSYNPESPAARQVTQISSVDLMAHQSRMNLSTAVGRHPHVHRSL
ncbi:unnamed protein product, partial [Rotaria sp. Silwood2]